MTPTTKVRSGSRSGSRTPPARIVDAKAVGVIENSDAMPRAWMARFGRTVTGQVPDMVAAQLEARPPLLGAAGSGEGRCRASERPGCPHRAGSDWPGGRRRCGRTNSGCRRTGCANCPWWRDPRPGVAGDRPPRVERERAQQFVFGAGGRAQARDALAGRPVPVVRFVASVHRSPLRVRRRTRFGRRGPATWPRPASISQKACKEYRMQRKGYTQDNHNSDNGGMMRRVGEAPGGSLSGRDRSARAPQGDRGPDGGRAP